MHIAQHIWDKFINFKFIYALTNKIPLKKIKEWQQGRTTLSTGLDVALQQV